MGDAIARCTNIQYVKNTSDNASKPTTTTMAKPNSASARGSTTLSTTMVSPRIPTTIASVSETLLRRSETTPTPPTSKSFTTKSKTKSRNENLYKHEFRTLYANIRGLITHKSDGKLEYLEGLVHNENIDLISLTETHLHQCEEEGCTKCVTNEEIKFKNYNVMRADRKNRQSGGCLLYLKDCYACEVLTAWSNGTVELLIVHINALNLNVVTIYRPPKTKEKDFQEMIEIIEETVDKHSNKAKNTIIMGDFNFPFINWKKRDDFVYIDSLTGGTNISKEDKNQAELLEQWMVKHTFMQVVTEKTRGKNILDLVITNISEQIIRLYTIPTDTNISDHKFIRIDLNLPTKQQISRETESEGIFSNLNTYSRNINWLNINKKISKTNWEGYLGDDSPEDILNKIESKIEGIIQEHIPKKGMKRKRNKYEQRIRILYKKRRRFIKQLLKSKSEKKKEEVETKLLKNDLELQKDIKTKKYEEEIYATEKNLNKLKILFHICK
jgi:hypothetical protein